MAVEYEVKSRLDSKTRAALIKMLPAEWEDASSTDRYFDTPDGALLARSVFARIRHHGILEIKVGSNSPHIRDLVADELSFDLPVSVDSANRLSEISGLEVNLFYPEFGLAPLVTVAKTRRTYTVGDIEVSLDDLGSLGCFVEFEARSEIGQRQVDEWASDLSLTPMQTGYVELALAVERPDLYRLARRKE